MHTLSIQSLMQTSNVGFGTSGARGLVSDMTDTLCYAYTLAFLQAVVSHPGPIVLGHDLRPSSPRMATACAAAMRDAGYTVIYAGALPTPALAYYAATLDAPCLVVTGSHIPFDRNGLKFYRADGEISKVDEALMRAAVVNVPTEIKPFILGTPDARARTAYVQRYLNFFGAKVLSGQRIGVYEHSSVARDVLREILQGLGAEVLSLGRTDIFVPIDTEAVRAEDVAQAKLWADEHAFDAILSTDGDGDRPLIGDETGAWLRGDIVGVLCAQYLAANIVVTPVSSNTAVELCDSFRKVIRTRIGSPYVIAGMDAAIMEADTQHNQVVVGYEANGGFLLGSDIVRDGRRLTALPTRDAVLPMLALLCMARSQGTALSQLSHRLPARYTASDRLQNVTNALSSALLARLTDDLTQAALLLAPDAGEVVVVNTADGLRLSFINGDIVHLRPSGNVPELRCYAEAGTALQAQRLCDAALKRLASVCV
ncbi:{ManB} Phosphomannomutase [Methylophilaceae bacterium]